MTEKWIVGEKFTLASGVVVTMGQDVDLDKNPLMLSNGERIDEKRAEEIAKEAAKRNQVEKGLHQFKD
jgi:hypothetical protein